MSDETPRVSRRKKLLLAFVATLVALAIGEAGARMVFWLNDELPPTGDVSLENEWKWADLHLREGKARLESDLVHDADTGWRVKPEIVAARGMVKPGSAEDAPHVLFVGDSYTFGLGVDGGDSYPAVLGRDLLPEWRVTNLAVPGTGTDQQLITFERDGLSPPADVVVLGFYVRDYSRNVVSFRDFAKPRFVADGDGLTLTASPVPTPDELYEEYRSGRREIGEGVRSYLFGTLAAALTRLGSRSYDEEKPGWQILTRLMARFDRSVRASGAVPVWVIIPYRDIEEQDSSHFEPLELLCESRCEELGMACLRLDRPFRELAREHPGRSAFRPKEDGGHLSVEGHEVAARALFTLLRDRGVLKTVD